MAMQNRRKFMLILTTGFVALAFVVGSTLADELIGYITKVDVAGKKLTVVEKDTDKEVEVTVTPDTEWVTKKETTKIDLEKIEKNVEKAKEKNRKVQVTVTHEKGTASKIAPIQQQKKKAAN